MLGKQFLVLSLVCLSGNMHSNQGSLEISTRQRGSFYKILLFNSSDVLTNEALNFHIFPVLIK